MAVQKFELAGASPSDIIVVLKNHVANVALPRDGDGDSRADPTNLQENMLEIKGEVDKEQ
jgi:hypothetical protein